MLYKYYVDVDTLIYKDGAMKPLFVHWKDHRYRVEKILSVRELFSRAGGCGICYTCRILGQDRRLFWERNRWFLESEVYDPAIQQGVPERKEASS